ncbi:hypothetical protein [Streptomyces sp. WM6378]|uniref:hypothetical protein n=1 Tax=Streptomyces sp. WM6378 TaxID=1415557 RepID=UPI0006AFC6A4|nr:hypothetical protein [Streptomyces sp. WM6378]KOU50093.1 hypothetical protein ADK54_10045 [Streptomyces sp. WM6378]
MTTLMTQHQPIGPPREFSPATTDLMKRLVAGLKAYETPAEFAERARITRRRLHEAVRTLALVPSPSPELVTAHWRARQMLLMYPADRNRPRPKYVAALSQRLTDLLVHRVAAAAYTCTPELHDLTYLHRRLVRAGEEHAGSVRVILDDRSLHEWPLSLRPGWKRVQRLVEDRQIGMLLVDSADALVPPEEIRDPGWDRQRIEARLASWGIRLVCLADADKAKGGAQ